MLALLFIDHRLAFLALAALLIAAAIPLAFAWARTSSGRAAAVSNSTRIVSHGRTGATAERLGDASAISSLSVALLVCLTIAYMIRFPGFPQCRLTSLA